MALLSEHISHITNILNQGAKPDSYRFTDKQIYFILKYLRSELLKQKLDRGYFINPYNYQTIPCVSLEYKDISDCECFTTNCKSLQTSCEIPRAMNSRRGLDLSVYTIEGNRLDRLTLDTIKLAKYSKSFACNLRGYYIENRIIHVVGYDRLKVLKIKGLFEDPLELASFKCSCDEEGNSCYDPYTMDFPLDLDLTRALNALTYEELLKISMQVPKDDTNDSQTTIQQTKR